jgi:transposase
VHVVVDNYATHKHPAVRAWLTRHPRVHLHFTPTSGSWLNLVEAFFSIITRQALRRGNFPTVADLIAAIERFVDAWNDRCTPFTRTKDPDTIIAKASHPRNRNTKTTSDTDH